MTSERPRVPTLSAVLSAVTGLVTILALTIAASLIVVTGILNRTSSKLADTIESFRVADEAEVELLLHGRAQDLAARRDIETSLHNRFVQARRFVTNDVQQAVLRQAERAVDQYITTANEAGRSSTEKARAIDEAYASLELLDETNLREGRVARESADRWHARAKALGLGLGFLIVGLSGWLLWWLRVRAFRPLLAMAESIERFARGERDARAHETGPAELRDMARRFNEMAEALAAQRQAQMSFLGGVAHDLRTPMSAMKLSMSAFTPDGPLPPEAKIRKTISVVQRQMARLERMTSDFLDIAKIEAGQLDIQLQRQDPRDLVRQVQELFEYGFPTRRLRVSVPVEDMSLWCDSLRIEQVLTNLVSNAIKYSPDATAVDVVLERRGGDVIFSVTDQGIGISDDDQRRLFEPFRRLGLSKETVPGVGLGLFVVNQIVRAHGGRIEITSAPGRGTTARAFLPLAPRDGERPSPAGAAPGEPATQTITGTGTSTGTGPGPGRPAAGAVPPPHDPS